MFVRFYFSIIFLWMLATPKRSQKWDYRMLVGWCLPNVSRFPAFLSIVGDWKHSKKKLVCKCLQSVEYFAEMNRQSPNQSAPTHWISPILLAPFYTQRADFGIWDPPISGYSIERVVQNQYRFHDVPQGGTSFALTPPFHGYSRYCI
jgi:hypothetical protein